MNGGRPEEAAHAVLSAGLSYVLSTEDFDSPLANLSASLVIITNDPAVHALSRADVMARAIREGRRPGRRRIPGSFRRIQRRRLSPQHDSSTTAAVRKRLPLKDSL